MPRRTYDPRNGRRRAPQTHGAALERLAAELAPAPPTTERPCVVCGPSLPPTWRHPEHARCRPSRGIAA